jgi:ABC-type uncharacterized transport system substrate-binding protein
MCIAVIGGMDRLQQHYRQEAAQAGIELRIFNEAGNNLGDRLGQVDALLIFTGKISHRARREVMKTARSRNIPIYQYHSCGVCTLRKCLSCLVPQRQP